jgi:hypothetical protein
MNREEALTTLEESSTRREGQGRRLTEPFSRSASAFESFDG